MLAILEKLNGAGWTLWSAASSRPAPGRGVFPVRQPPADRPAAAPAGPAGHVRGHDRPGGGRALPERLPFREEGDIEGIRLTFHREDTDRALRWAREIGERGVPGVRPAGGDGVLHGPGAAAAGGKGQPPAALRLLYRGHPGQHVPQPAARQFHLIDGNMDSGIRWGSTATTTCSWPFPTPRPWPLWRQSGT